MMAAAAFLLLYTLDGQAYAQRYDVLASCVRDARHYTNGRCEPEPVGVGHGVHMTSDIADVAPKKTPKPKAR